MLERIILFLVIGVFVFIPAVSDWWRTGLIPWYKIYLPWLLLIFCTVCLHLAGWFAERRDNQDNR